MSNNPPSKLNIANIIAATRLIAIPIVIATTFMGLQNATGWIIFIALSTDLIDGPIARKLKIPRWRKRPACAPQ